MSKYEILKLRQIVAEAEFAENVSIRLNEIEMVYTQNLESIEKLAETTEDLELLCSALWESYEHEVATLKELCVKHNVSKATMLKLFR